MSTWRLALRMMLLGQPRTLAAALLVAASLCALDLFAGHIASQRTGLEYQAVVGERLGHLAILGAGGAGSAFDQAEAGRIKRLAEGVKGVALVVPQIHLAGVASTGGRSAFFTGAGIVPVPPEAPDSVQGQPGALQPDQPNGIAVSSGQAQSLGLRHGSPVTLTGVALDARPIPLNAQVVDIFGTAGLGASARTVLLPLEMAQSLLDSGRTERLAVYLSNPRELDRLLPTIKAELARAGVKAEVRSWRQLSVDAASADSSARLRLTCAALAALAVVWACIAATLAMNGQERRTQLATLGALGMRRGAIYRLVTAEALWITVLGAALSLATSGLIAWVVNRAALSWAAAPGTARPQLLVELDFNRMLLALVAVLAVALVAALPPALKAARADVARGLRWDCGHPGW
jgi:ABC-type lipoprotein release transport system permease subunit